MVAALCLTLVACGGEVDKVAAPKEDPSPGLTLTETSLSALEGFAGDAVIEALPALRRSCRRLLRQPDDRPVGPEGLAGTVADWRGPCADLDGLSERDEAGLRAVLTARFVPYRLSSARGEEGLFTGYYESELDGGLTPSGPGATPLYGPPDDMIEADLGAFRPAWKGERLHGRVEGGRLVPYHDRAAVEDGALEGRAAVLAWADDPVEAFIMQIQGSGRMRLKDGAVRRFGFAASNGHPFTAIGRLMLQRELIGPAQANMPAIRDWLRAHPEEARALMRENARYIFFREIEGDGPIGAQGVALTPGRSLAVDRRYLPLGAPLFLETRWPGGGPPLNRLVVAQDTGAAIKGEIRGDLFWGAGEPAFQQAGRMKEPGRLTLFLPRTVAERRRLGS